MKLHHLCDFSHRPCEECPFNFLDEDCPLFSSKDTAIETLEEMICQAQTILNDLKK